MLKPIVILITRNCSKLCRCGLGRNLLQELKDKGRCDAVEFNLDTLPKDHPMIKESARRGWRYFPTFIIQHPQQKILDVKVWGNNDKNDGECWKTNRVRNEIEAAITAVWRAK